MYYNTDISFMSILFIENGYCCGHGEIVNRLENWCLANKIQYQKRKITGKSTAKYGKKRVILSPSISLSSVLEALGLQSSRS